MSHVKVTDSRIINIVKPYSSCGSVVGTFAFNVGLSRFQSHPWTTFFKFVLRVVRVMLSVVRVLGLVTGFGVNLVVRRKFQLR